MNILLTGKTGQLGHELHSALQGHGTIIAPDRHQMDLSNLNQIRDVIRTVKPDVIINSAAYTAVDQAETCPELAMRINAEAPATLAEEAQRLGARLIHYSTDYVFDGNQTTPYTEQDHPNPQSIYGRTKWLGEQAVMQCPAHWIIRTSWVYGVHGGNFMKTIMRLAQERESLRIVSDQIGTPTWARRLADITVFALDATTSRESMLETTGLYHLSAQGETTWHKYAVHVVTRMRENGIPTQLLPEHIQPIPTEDYPLPAARPRYSKLSNTKWERTFHKKLEMWSSDMDQCLKELFQGRNNPL